MRKPAMTSQEAMLRLAIVLLEICFCQTLESQVIRKSYMGPDGRPSDLTDAMTAHKWQEKVIGALGDGYASAVSWCIQSHFGKPDLDDPAFRESVYSYVVEPLQEYARIMN